MATLALSLAGQAAGSLFGPLGAAVGRALGGLAGAAIDNALFGGGNDTGYQGRDLRLQSASEGLAISRIYGWNRVTGNIIWATELEKLPGQSTGSKGTGSSGSSEDILVANFAVAFCEGEVDHIGRIWADGQLLATENLNIRFYNGTEDQLPDGLISAKQGTDNAPAYRGVCYAVFERLPLEQFGNRIPSISVELCRLAGDLEQSIKAVCLIPGSTEFGYDPQPRVRIVGAGAVESENAHVVSDVSNWTLSIDELQAMCPNLQHVALVVAWFGDDLRCGNCLIQPRSEGADRQTKNIEWQVQSLGRTELPVVSSYGDGLAYGGTPSDASVIAAIADLKARGINVTLYPFIMMDIEGGNTLPDPFNPGGYQPAYPWRGRITCHPAPGVSGTPDQTATAATQVASFVGAASPSDFAGAGNAITYSGPAEWSYRRFILHYAKLAQLAGGVDGLLIGSEMQWLTPVRNSAASFPFVDALIDLSNDVRMIVGESTNIVYAANWGEYHGYQPSDAPGDKLFHLDDLWAHPEIDAIGIDNYMPLADWRDGDSHIDRGVANSPHDIGYLQSNIAGGEGYDWYYASDADREAQIRTPIADGAYGEDWVWRVKDIHGWWSNAHHNRIAGVRQATPTAWVPQSKPIWLTEVGCGAVDKGANMPSAFSDPKSVENTKPYFSNGLPDVTMQRQFLRAHLNWWNPAAPEFVSTQNPTSTVYADPMVDADRIYLWTWDARPYPAFPQLSSVWSDGPNYATGHWLNGRLGSQSAGEIMSSVAVDYDIGLTINFTSEIKVEGLQIDRVVSMRDATETIANVADLLSRDRAGTIEIGKILPNIDMSIARDDLVMTDGPRLSRKRPDASAQIGHLGLSYAKRENAYLTAMASAFALQGTGSSALNSGLVMGDEVARLAAEQALSNAVNSVDTLELGLPSSSVALEVGDIIAIEGERDGPFLVTDIRDGAFRKVSARAIGSRASFSVASSGRANELSIAPATGDPIIYLAHLPAGDGTSQVVGAGYSDPWPGEIIIKEPEAGRIVMRLRYAAYIGNLTAPISNTFAGLWDDTNICDVSLINGHLSSATESAVLGGVNRAAIERDDGSWEIIGFANAELIAPSTYRLTHLLRGLNGSAEGNATPAAGARFILLDGRETYIDPPLGYLGSTVTLNAYSGNADPDPSDCTGDFNLAPVIPLAPSSLSTNLDAVSGDIAFSWIRRSRIEGSSWSLVEVPLDFSPEAYQLKIYDGAVLKRTIASSAPSATYTLAQQTTDFGAAATSFTYEVVQLSAIYGAGHPASAAYSD